MNTSSISSKKANYRKNFLNRRKAYVKDVVHLCKPGRSRSMSTHKAVFGSG